MKVQEDDQSNSENVKLSNPFYFEEECTKLDGCAHDLLQYRDHCSALRKLVKSAWQSKVSGEKINVAQFASIIVSMKELNRRTQFRIRKARDITSSNKSKVDHLHLSLQNLLYEVSHLENEIHTCLDFRSRHEDMKLIPIAEFYEKSGHKPGSFNLHQETLEHLYWELEQRKILSKSTEKLKASVEVITQRIKKKLNYLNSFGPKLKDITESTLVVQELMGLPFTQEEEQYKLAFMLPEALYILYAHLKSYITMSATETDFTVTVEGDADIAKSVNQSMRQPTNHYLPLDEESDVEDFENNKKRKKSRHKSNNDADLMSHTNCVKLHPLTLLLKFNTELFTGLFKDCGFYVHLSFAWILQLNLITVRLQLPPFEIMPHNLLSKTGCDLLCSEQLLSNLVWTPDTSTNQTKLIISSDLPSAAVCQSIDSIDWDACAQIGRPYEWAQQLVGLHCYPDRLPTTTTTTLIDTDTMNLRSDEMTNTPPDNSAGNMKFGQIEAWLKAVQTRIIDRLYFMQELCEIEQSKLCLSTRQQQLLPSTNQQNVRIISWEKSNFEKLQTVTRGQVMIALDLIQQVDTIFKCELGHSEQVTITVWISVPPDYPSRAPIFVLDNLIEYVTTVFSSSRVSKNNNSNAIMTDLTELHVQELEAEINCHWKEFFHLDETNSIVEQFTNKTEFDPSTTKKFSDDSHSKWDRNILTCQLARCCVCIQALCQDQVLRCQETKSHVNSGDSCTADTTTASSSSSIGTRNIKYPTRSRPLRYLPCPGVFIHR